MNAVKSYKEFVVSYRRGTVDENVLAHSFYNDIFYKEISEFKIKNGMTLIDVGAHIGTFSLLSASLSSNNLIIGLEPNSETFKIFEKNIIDNKMEDQIIPIKSALTNKDGEVKLYLGDENWEHSITNDSSSDYEIVNSRSLKSIFQQFEIQECDLVKFNCEGGEFLSVLSTPPEVLGRIKMMLILFHEDMEGDYDRNDLVNYLSEHSFLIRFAKLTSNRGWIIAKNKSHYSGFENKIIKMKRELSRFLLPLHYYHRRVFRRDIKGNCSERSLL